MALLSKNAGAFDDDARHEAIALLEAGGVGAACVRLCAVELNAQLVEIHGRAAQERYLATQSIKAGSGARYVARTIAKLVTNPLSSAILRGDIKEGGAARVELHEHNHIEVIAA